MATHADTIFTVDGRVWATDHLRKIFKLVGSIQHKIYIRDIRFVGLHNKQDNISAMHIHLSEGHPYERKTREVCQQRSIPYTDADARETRNCPIGFQNKGPARSHNWRQEVSVESTYTLRSTTMTSTQRTSPTSLRITSGRSLCQNQTND